MQNMNERQIWNYYAASCPNSAAYINRWTSFLRDDKWKGKKKVWNGRFNSVVSEALLRSYIQDILILVII